MRKQDRLAGFIRAQPEAVRAALDAARAFLEAWQAPKLPVVLVGSGSSMNALLVAEGRFPAAALRGPRDFTDDPQRHKGHLVIVLSQSGVSTTSVAALRAARGDGLPALAITAEAASPFAAAARETGAACLVLPIGPESIGPKTKGFAACTAALFALAEAMGGPALPPFGPPDCDLAALIEPSRELAFRMAARLDEVDALLLAGRGRMHGAAQEAALKLAEIAGIPCGAWPLEEVLHGRLHGLTARGRAYVLPGDDDDRDTARRAWVAMARRGASVTDEEVSATPLPPPWDALGILLLYQWLAVALAERRGLPPERMRYPGLSADLAIKLADGRS